MARPAQTDWEICKCHHTINTHMRKGELGKCRGLYCECEKFEKMEKK